MDKIRIYTTTTCGYCYAAKELLRQKGLQYEEIDVTGDEKQRAWLRTATGQRTVPQIFIGERSLGGYTALDRLDRSGELDRMLKDSASKQREAI
jgi:glutaredoxin 3